MLATQKTTAPMSESIPDPQIVRERLGDTLREANLLRQLLRIAEKAHQQRARRKEVEASHA